MWESHSFISRTLYKESAEGPSEGAALESLCRFISSIIRLVFCVSSTSSLATQRSSSFACTFQNICHCYPCFLFIVWSPNQCVHCQQEWQRETPSLSTHMRSSYQWSELKETKRQVHKQFLYKHHSEYSCCLYYVSYSGSRNGV